MTDDLAALNFDNLPEGQNSPAATLDAEPNSELQPEGKSQPKRKRALLEAAPILGGVFLGVALVAWLISTFFFEETTEQESTLELPRNRMESVSMEIGVGKVRYQGPISKAEANQPQTAFIVEVDATIIVQGTSSELLEVEAMLKSHHHRVEEAIDETIRAATPAHLNEPDVLIIRTRIRDRINQYLGKQIVQEVLFGDYRAFHTPIKS